MSDGIDATTMLSVAEIARRLGVHRSSIYRTPGLRRRLVPLTGRGGRVGISEQDLLAYLAEQRHLRDETARDAPRR